jgi:hypothetical protein
MLLEWTHLPENRSDWKQADSIPIGEDALASLDVRYAYLWGYCSPGSLRIDGITLLNE